MSFSETTNKSGGYCGQPLAAHSHLAHRFFTGNIQYFMAVFRNTVQCLKHEGRFADSRISADEDKGSGDQAAAQDAVEFSDSG